MINRAEILSNIKRIELRLKGQSSNINNGTYKSAFKGQGMIFSEVRNYHIGDDVRKIDWNVTARFQEPHVKVFDQEKDKNVIFLIDVSSSNLIAFEKHFKFMKTIEIVSTLLLSAQYEQLNFGAMLFSDSKEAYFPPSKGRNHLLKILNTLIDSFSMNKRSSLEEPFKWFKNNRLKKSTLFIISDFRMGLNYVSDLAVLSSSYQIHMIRINNRKELNLPNAGWMELYNPETSQKSWINTSNKQSREKFLELYEKNDKVLDEVCAKNKIKICEVDIEKEVFDQIRNAFY